MSSQIDEPANHSRQIVGLSLLVMLSLALPVAIIFCSAKWAFSGKLLGLPSNSQRVYQGALFNGELWFKEWTANGGRPGGAFQNRIVRMDLSTGVEHKTGIESTDFLFPIRINGEIFAVSQTALYRLSGSTVEKLASCLVGHSQFESMPFLYDGQLTMVVAIKEGGFRFVHLVDGRWVDGRKIRLPDPGCVWFQDSQRGKNVLLPKTSLAPSTIVGRTTYWEVHVLPHERGYDVLLSDDPNFAAYRHGFEFDEDDPEVASAIAPENALADVSGWERIKPCDVDERWFWMGRDQHGVLFATFGRPFHVVRRTDDGQWRELAGAEHLTMGSTICLFADPTESTTYLIAENQRWQNAAIHRIVDDVIQPAHIRIPGRARGYLARWEYLGLGIVIAWLTHVGIVCSGAAWLTFARANSIYEFGVQRVALASTLRRSVAFAINLLILLALLGLLAWWQSKLLATPFEAMSEQELADFLFQYDQALESGLSSGSLLANLRGVISFELLTSSFQTHRDFLMLCIAEAIVIISSWLLLEGWFGATPGKWLLGIKTVRSTLRPCGLSRILIRFAMYFCDIPLLITPLPGLISIVLSPQRQRIGDRIADTVVIRNR